MRKEPKHPVDAVFERALSHRTSPPHTATWEAVRAGQDKPWSSAEEALIKNLNARQASPKPSSWRQIEAHIHPAKRRVFLWYRWTAAASVLLVATLAWWDGHERLDRLPQELSTVTGETPSMDLSIRTAEAPLTVEPSSAVIRQDNFEKGLAPHAIGSILLAGQVRGKPLVQWMPIALQEIEENLQFVAIPEVVKEPRQPLEPRSLKRRGNWLRPTSPWSKAITAYVATQSARAKKGQSLQAPWSNYTIAVEVKVPPKAHSFIQNTLTHP